MTDSEQDRKLLIVEDDPGLQSQMRWSFERYKVSLADNRAAAIAEIRRASQTGLPNYPAFRNDPHFAPLHDAPEWKTLMADLEREHAAFRGEFGRRQG